MREKRKSAHKHQNYSAYSCALDASFRTLPLAPFLPQSQAELSGYVKVGRSWQQCVAVIDPLTTPPLAVSKMCTSILRRDSYTPLRRFQVCFLISRFLFGWNCIPQASIGSLNVYLMPVTEMTRAKHWNTPKAWGQLTWFLKRLHFQLWDIKEKPYCISAQQQVST